MDMRRCRILPMPPDTPPDKRVCLMLLANEPSPGNRCRAAADFVLADVNANGLLLSVGFPLCQQHANDCIAFGADAPGD